MTTAEETTPTPSTSIPATDDTTTLATTEPGGSTTVTTSTGLITDSTATADDNNMHTGSSGPDQPTTNTDAGETSTAITNMGGASTTDTQQSTTAGTTAGTTVTYTGTSTSAEFEGSASPIFSCSIFTMELEIILHSTVSDNSQ